MNESGEKMNDPGIMTEDQAALREARAIIRSILFERVPEGNHRTSGTLIIIPESEIERMRQFLKDNPDGMPPDPDSPIYGAGAGIISRPGENDLMQLEDLESWDPIHNWFGLSYSAYLVLPRSILQSASKTTQQTFVLALEALEVYFEGIPIPARGEYWVSFRGPGGRFISDPLCQYERGRRVVTVEELRELSERGGSRDE